MDFIYFIGGVVAAGIVAFVLSKTKAKTMVSVDECNTLKLEAEKLRSAVTFKDESISELKYEYGLSMTDIIYEIHFIFLNKLVGINNDKKMDDLTKSVSTEKMIFIIDKMRDIEYNLSVCTREVIQLGALIGLFK